MQERFDQLRLADLAGMLTDEDQAELAALTAILEADELEQLAPGIEQMRKEQEVLRRHLEVVQAENAELLEED